MQFLGGYEHMASKDSSIERRAESPMADAARAMAFRSWANTKDRSARTAPGRAAAAQWQKEQAARRNR